MKNTISKATHWLLRLYAEFYALHIRVCCVGEFGWNARFMPLIPLKCCKMGFVVRWISFAQFFSATAATANMCLCLYTIMVDPLFCYIWQNWNDCSARICLLANFPFTFSCSLRDFSTLTLTPPPAIACLLHTHTYTHEQCIYFWQKPASNTQKPIYLAQPSAFLMNRQNKFTLMRFRFVSFSYKNNWSVYALNFTKDSKWPQKHKPRVNTQDASGEYVCVECVCSLVNGIIVSVSLFILNIRARVLFLCCCCSIIILVFRKLTMIGMGAHQNQDPEKFAPPRRRRLLHLFLYCYAVAITVLLVGCAVHTIWNLSYKAYCSRLLRIFFGTRIWLASRLPLTENN